MKDKLLCLDRVLQIVSEYRECTGFKFNCHGYLFWFTLTYTYFVNSTTTSETNQKYTATMKIGSVVLIYLISGRKMSTYRILVSNNSLIIATTSSSSSDPRNNYE